MKVFFDILCQSFRSNFVYRANLFGHLVVLVFNYGTRLLVLGGLFQYTNNLAGWTETEAKLLLFITMLAGLFADIFDVSILQFYRQVALGTIQPFLTKPINPYILMMTRWSKPSSFIIFLFLLPFFYYFIQIYSISISIVNWFLFFITFFCGFICNISFISLLSLSTFLIQRTLPIDYIYSEIFRLCPYPLTLYPKNSLGFLIVLIPSIFCSSLPSYVLLRGGYELAFVFMLSTILIILLHHLGFKFMLRRYESFGG